MYEYPHKLKFINTKNNLKSTFLTALFRSGHALLLDKVIKDDNVFQGTSYIRTMGLGL
jgi:hypothetical protein